MQLCQDLSPLQAPGASSALSGGWSPERGRRGWSPLRWWGPSVLCSAAAIRGIGPAPHHFGLPEFLACLRWLLGLQGRGAGQGAPLPPSRHSQSKFHCPTEQVKHRPQKPAMVTVCLPVCLLPPLSSQRCSLSPWQGQAQCCCGPGVLAVCVCWVGAQGETGKAWASPSRRPGRLQASSAQPWLPCQLTSRAPHGHRSPGAFATHPVASSTQPLPSLTFWLGPCTPHVPASGAFTDASALRASTPAWPSCLPAKAAASIPGPHCRPGPG